MAKEKTAAEQPKEKPAAKDSTPPTNALTGRKVFWTEKRVETVVAVLLGVTTLLSAWATWIGSLHSGIQSINFTKSNGIDNPSFVIFGSCLKSQKRMQKYCIIAGSVLLLQLSVKIHWTFRAATMRRLAYPPDTISSSQVIRISVLSKASEA